MRTWYQDWQQANKWQDSVNYGSVMTSWTPEMFKILAECGNDKNKAAEVLAKRKAQQG